MLEKPTKPIYKKDQKFNKLIGTAIKVIPENCSCWDKSLHVWKRLRKKNY